MKEFVKKYWPSILIISTVLSLVLLLVLYFLKFGTSCPNGFLSCSLKSLSSSTSDWGTFGDYIGGTIGTLFSIVGTVLIYMTYKNQVASTERQINLAYTQQFETTFFNLLQNYKTVIGNINNESYKLRKSRSMLAKADSGYAYTEYLEDIYQALKGLIRNKPEENIVKESIKNIMNSNTSSYFKYIFHLLMYIDESKTDNPAKYVNIMSSQMQDYELYLLFYKASFMPEAKFANLLDKYSFLEDVPSDKSPLMIELAKKHYPNTKFKYLTPDSPQTNTNSSN
jgi:hypothetical protein